MASRDTSDDTSKGKGMREDEAAPGDASAVEGRGQAGRASLRPRHCWEIVRQIPGLHFSCEECYAYFVQQDCWTLWALRRPGFKPCCQKKGDCTECAILIERMRPQSDEQIEIERRRPLRPIPASAKRICNYLQLYSGGESVEGEGRNSQITRALQVRNADFRCRLRGVHLDMSYVNDVCVSRHVEECVFLDEEHPEVHLRPLPMLKAAAAPAGDTRYPEKGVAKHTGGTDPLASPSVTDSPRVERKG